MWQIKLAQLAFSAHNNILILTNLFTKLLTHLYFYVVMYNTIFCLLGHKPHSRHNLEFPTRISHFADCSFIQRMLYFNC